MPNARSASQSSVRMPKADVVWFCLRSQPRHEHIAAGHLRRMEGIEVFNPRIRFARPTRHGPVWVTEALFPNYLFARFNWQLDLNKVHYAPGVSGIVHFGSRWPIVPEEVIQQLKSELGNQELHVISNQLRPGDKVEIAGGTLHGLEAVVSQVLPGRQRVIVLMDFLGRQTMVEVDVGCVLKHVTR